jgi:hypothetical protein
MLVRIAEYSYPPSSPQASSMEEADICMRVDLLACTGAELETKTCRVPRVRIKVLTVITFVNTKSYFTATESHGSPICRALLRICQGGWWVGRWVGGWGARSRLNKTFGRNSEWESAPFGARAMILSPFSKISSAAGLRRGMKDLLRTMPHTTAPEKRRLTSSYCSPSMLSNSRR